MKAFVARRLVMTVVLLFLVALTVFLLGHLSGDPVRLMVPEDATAQQIADLRHADEVVGVHERVVRRQHDAEPHPSSSRIAAGGSGRRERRW